MKYSRFTPSVAVVAAGALFMGVPLIMAGEGHDHAKHEHSENADHKGHAAETAVAGAVMSSHDGMTALYGHLQEISSALEAGNVEGVHNHAEEIGASVKDLDKDTSLAEAKKKRVRGYVKNVLKLADKVHHAADEKKMDLAKKDFAKLQAQVDLLDKQFPHSHKPGATEKAKEAETHAH